MKAEKNNWVQIYNVILNPEERAQHLPQATKEVPLEMWVNGFALHEAEIGEKISVKTLSGRTVEGELVNIFPNYKISFGKHVPEVMEINNRLKKYLSEGDNS